MLRYTGERASVARRDRQARILIRRQRMLPRPVLPRQFYLVTRRCAQRQFLLRPDAATNNAFLYCLIAAALRSEIDVLLPCAMSNHYLCAALHKWCYGQCLVMRSLPGAGSHFGGVGGGGCT